ARPLHHLVDVAVGDHVHGVGATRGRRAPADRGQHQPRRRQAPLGDDHGRHRGDQEELDDAGLRQRDVGTDPGAQRAHRGVHGGQHNTGEPTPGRSERAKGPTPDGPWSPLRCHGPSAFGPPAAPAVAWAPVRPLRAPPPVLRRIALALLVSLVAVSVIGAVVRLTGSGLGCSPWPNCEPDSFTPRSASDGHAMVEFTNRLVNAAVGLLGVAAVDGALRRDPRRSDLVRWALATFAWIAGNGLVGALVV